MLLEGPPFCLVLLGGCGPHPPGGSGSASSPTSHSCPQFPPGREPCYPSVCPPPPPPSPAAFLRSSHQVSVFRLGRACPGGPAKAVSCGGPPSPFPAPVLRGRPLGRAGGQGRGGSGAGSASLGTGRVCSRNALAVMRAANQAVSRNDIPEMSSRSCVGGILGSELGWRPSHSFAEF